MADTISKVGEFFLLLLGQFAGGPGPPENNLVRFGMPVILWALLFYVAWSRQRSQAIPRERLLLWGFGLGLARELFMFVAIVIQIWNPEPAGPEPGMHQPLEHSLAMAAVVVVAGAFLRYILDNEKISQRYLQVGIGITVACLLIVSWFWPRHQAADPQIMFHQTWEAWLFHLPLSILIIIAIAILRRESGWLRNVVVTALIFFLLSEMLILLNYATDRSYNHIICPIGNSLHMLAIPLLAYVYLKELSIEKERAEASLSAYRDHLEELVEERTTALKKVNLQLNQEIGDRKQAEMEIARHNDRLAAQNTVAATLSESLDLDVILNSALDAVLSLLVMEVGFIYLIDPEDSSLQLKINRGKFAREALQVSLNEECLCRQTSMNAVESGGVAIQYLDSAHDNQLSTCFSETKLLTLVSIPLVSKGRVVGVMTLGAARAQAIQQEDYELLIAIGQQIGMALENATLYQDAEHWSGELVRLHQASAGLTSALDTEQILQEIVRQSAWLLRCPIALVCSWLSSRQSVEIVASHGLTSAEEERLPNSPYLIPLLNELLRKQRSLAIHDVPLDGCTSAYGQNNGRTGNLICLPLRGQQQPREFLLLLDRQPGHVWQARELELIENFANRASVALIHANLHQQMERTAALEERQRIAADMHDGLAQMLSLLGLKVDRAHELLETGDNQATENELHQMREVVGRASDEARRSIARLQKPVRRQRSLQELLTKLIDQFQSEYSTPVSFSEQISEPLILPLEQRDLVLPVVQEALLNAQRHAQSQKIFLLLERHGDNIKITVEDDGRGFLQPRSQNSQAGHFGLSIMQARAARIGGQLEVDSTPGQGTRVTLKWSQKQEQQPVPAQDPEALSQPSTPILSLEVGL